MTSGVRGLILIIGPCLLGLILGLIELYREWKELDELGEELKKEYGLN